MSVSLFDTSSPLAPLREELREAIARVVDSSAFVLGPEVEAFEREFAAHVGAAHAIGRRQRHRCADDRAAGDGRRPG